MRPSLTRELLFVTQMVKVDIVIRNIPLINWLIILLQILVPSGKRATDPKMHPWYSILHSMFEYYYNVHCLLSEIHCLTPSRLLHGTMTTPEASTRVYSNITYYCNEPRVFNHGYSSITIQCQLSATWRVIGGATLMTTVDDYLLMNHLISDCVGLYIAWIFTCSIAYTY